MDIAFLTARPRERGLLGVEKATLAYTVFTVVLMLVFWSGMHDPMRLLIGRAFVVAGMAACIGAYRCAPSRATLLLRTLYPLTLLAYWYPDTYEFCQLFPNLDHVFAGADFALFGCQPALEFSRHVPSVVWSELFNMGYFSYYPLIAFTVFAPCFFRRELIGQTSFVILASFFAYYFIYLFLPVAGPQYYFHAVDVQAVGRGEFPVLGDYFRTHTELRPSTAPAGFFHQLVEQTQQSGERPTAAFPSSHVGISTVLLLLLFRVKKSLVLWVLPFYVLLCCATVYIEAHYLVDVFAGLLSAPLIFWLSLKLWQAQRPAGHDPYFF